MNDRDGFLRTIIENPHEDLPRLVFADWLEEQGDPRAEFIRVQCALAGMSIDDASRPELIVREHALLKENEDAWVGKLKSLVKSYSFRRGFIESVTVLGRPFLTRADELFALAPIRTLRLTQLGIGKYPAAELAAMPQLARLDALELTGVAGDERINTILSSPHLKQLTRLALDEVRCGEQSLLTIFSGALPRLDMLELIGDEMSAFTRLICRPKIPLREYSIKSASGVLNRESIAELARAKNLAGLAFLDLRNSKIQVPGATALAKSKVLTNLQILGLKGCAIGVTGMQALSESANLAGLTALNVERNHIGINGLRGIVGAAWPHLTSLNLAINDLDDRCVPLLREWAGLARLRYLNLSNDEISDDATAELLSAPELAHLWQFELGGLGPGEKTANVLNNAPHLAGLRTLKDYHFGFSRYQEASHSHSGTRVNIH